MGNIYCDMPTHPVHDDLRTGTFHLMDWNIIRNALKHYVTSNECVEFQTPEQAEAIYSANLLQKDISMFVLEDNDD
jgi:hypothetical protein